MKQFFTTLCAFACAAITWAATETTVYFAPTAEWLGSYTLKLNVNFKGDGDDWHQYNMMVNGETIDGNAVYTYTFTDAYNGLGKLQFQCYDGSTWKKQVQAFDTWTAVDNYNGKLYDGTNWVTYTPDVTPDPVVPFVKISAPTTVKSGENLVFDTLKTVNFTATPTFAYTMLSPKSGAVWTACTSPIVPDTIGTYKIAVEATNNAEIAHDTVSVSVTVDHYLAGAGDKLGNWVANAIPMFGDSITISVAQGDSLCFKVTDGTWSNVLDYTAVNSECSSRGCQAFGSNNNILVIAKSAGEAKIKIVDNKICITGDFVAPFLGDWFQFKYGKTDGADWLRLDFTADTTTANHFVADFTLPTTEALDTLECYVAYNNGEGNPVWVADKSSKIFIKDIRNFSFAGDAGKLEIWKDSESTNWYLGFVSSVAPDTTFAFKYGVAETSGWNSIGFVKDTIANRYVASYTVPDAAALDTLSCYVARSNGYGTPVWIDGMSETVKISDVKGVVAEQTGRLVIWSNSTSKNWYLAFEFDITSYTIAGDSVLLGSKWDINDANNDMVYDAVKDAWTLTKSNVTLAAKDYNYKVVGNHNWNAFQLPADGNQQLTIGEKGIYNVTFTYNPSAADDKLSALAEKVGSLAPDTTHFHVVVPEGTTNCYIASNVNNWTFTAMDKIDDTHYSLSVVALSDTVAYKYACNNDWAYAEVDSTGATIANRTWAASDTIAHWAKEVVIISSYTIVGDSLLVGYNWNPEAAANDLIFDDVTNNYTLTKNNVALKVGTYEYKLVANHAWGVKEVPETGNETLQIDEAAYYDITFSFDAETNTLSCNATKQQAGEEKYEVVYGIEGEDNWQHIALAQIEETTTWQTAELVLPADISTYKCYVAYNQGIGDPIWIADKSATVELTTINGASNEGKGKFKIYSDSNDQNWYLWFENTGTTGLENVTITTINAHDGRIYSNSQMRIYTLTGIDVTRNNGQLNGIYIVRCGETATKVVVR